MTWRAIVTLVVFCLLTLLLTCVYVSPELARISSVVYRKDGTLGRGGNHTEEPSSNVYSGASRHGNAHTVPNVVHYIWFNTSKSRYRFDHMIGALSVYKVQRPDVIYFHCDAPPWGPYFDRVKRLPTFKVMYMAPPRTLRGENITEAAYETSYSNIARVSVLLEHGGIYLDTDVIVISPLDEFRRYPTTIGLETEIKVCGGVIIAEKGAPFLYIWLNAYLDDHRVEEWAYNSGVVPGKLARRYPELVHVVPEKFHRPNWTEKEVVLIWGSEGFRWWKNYTVHLWYRMYSDLMHKEPSFFNIKQWPGAFGEMCRYVLYDERPEGYRALVT